MTSRASTVNRLDNLASIIKAKKEQERAEYDALPEVVIDCAVHGEQHVKLMPGQEADRIECPLCVEERRRREDVLYHFRDNSLKLADLLGDVLSPYCEEQTFESFRVTAQGDKRPLQQKAFKACRQFAVRFSERLLSGDKARSRVGILMHGHFGNGKTHLASAITSVVRDQGFRPVFLRALTLFNAFRSRSDKANSLAKLLAHCPLLIIDELGRSTGSEFERNQLIEIIDARGLLGYPTIIITNLDGKGYLELMGGAIASRTQTLFYPVAFDWDDYRKGQNISDMSIEEIF